MAQGVEGKVQVICPCCEVQQWAAPTQDGRFKIDIHHEPDDSPLCMGGEKDVGKDALVAQDTSIPNTPVTDTSWFLN